jgi:hypothetical protein
MTACVGALSPVSMDMDGNGVFAGRLEDVEMVRWRRWSEAEKARIVAESLGPSETSLMAFVLRLQRRRPNRGHWWR